MNQFPLVSQAGRRMFFALSLLSILFTASCSKEAINPKSDPPDKINATNLKSLASTDDSYTPTAPIVLNGESNVTISGDYITGGYSPCITLINCNNIHITHCKLVNSTTLGINISGCTQILIDSSYIENVSTGVYAYNSSSIQVRRNQMRNMQGPFPRGAFVQFDNVSGTKNRIMNNKLENIMGESYPEDAISMYKSNGTAEDPIIIMANQIRGGGPSRTGGGIMLGDQGGSYQSALYNTLVNPGQYGMAVSGGSNMRVLYNVIYGKAQYFTNVGLYYWNQSGRPSSNVTISGNKVNFSSGQYGLNDSFIGWNNDTPFGWDSNIWDNSLNEDILPETIINF